MYENDQTCSPAFSEHVTTLAKYLLEERGVKNSQIVEVGCGTGYFLKKLIEGDPGNVGHGFDPSYRGPQEADGGRLSFHKRYYDGTCARIQADVVLCRHVIEHVPDPLALLGAIRDALAESPAARVFFETPCVEWILKNQVIWDFFYEHCSYFSPSSLATAFERTGFKVECVRHVFGGQYLWLEAVVGQEMNTIQRGPGEVPALAQSFAAAEETLKADLQERVRRLRATDSGEIALWGAGAKGVTIANLIDPDRKAIACVVDLNPNKQGKFVPGTGHPIVSYHDLPRHHVKAVLLANPNYYEENLAFLRQAHIKVRLLNLMQESNVI
jgi:SAM-dependent methyltransferase